MLYETNRLVTWLSEVTQVKGVGNLGYNQIAKLGYLREFPTPVILDQARERGGSAGKICDRFSEVNCYPPYPFVSRGTEGTDRQRRARYCT